MSKFFTHDELKYKHLIGKPFILGTNDCYSIARDIFHENTPLRLPNYARPTDFWLVNISLYMDNFKKEGFKVIDVAPEDLQPLDVFLIALPDQRQDNSQTITGHCAVYVGEGRIVHHLMGRLSEEMVYRGSMRQWTTCVIRHPDVPKLIPKRTDLNLMERMLPHKRKIMEEMYEDAKRSGKRVEGLSHSDLFPGGE